MCRLSVPSCIRSLFQTLPFRPASNPILVSMAPTIRHAPTLRAPSSAVFESSSLQVARRCSSSVTYLGSCPWVSVSTLQLSRPSLCHDICETFDLPEFSSIGQLGRAVSAVSTGERSLLDHLLAGLIDENVLLWVTGLCQSFDRCIRCSAGALHSHPTSLNVCSVPCYGGNGENSALNCWVYKMVRAKEFLFGLPLLILFPYLCVKNSPARGMRLRVLPVLPVLSLLLGARASSLGWRDPAPHRLDVRDTSGVCTFVNTELIVSATSGSTTNLTDLRIASVLTLWITGTLGAAFPIIAHSSHATHIPRTIFEYIFTSRCYFLSYKLAQVCQIFRLYCHNLCSVYTPPRTRY